MVLLINSVKFIPILIQPVQDNSQPQQILPEPHILHNLVSVN